MKILLRERGRGKTTILMKWLEEKPKRILVVYSYEEKCRLQKEYPWVSNKIISFNEKMKLFGIDVDEIALDNADIMLQVLFNKTVSIASFTLE